MKTTPKAQKQTQKEISSSPEKESQSHQKGWWQDDEAKAEWTRGFLEEISKQPPLPYPEELIVYHEPN
jgi:hypothetical protein